MSFYRNAPQEKAPVAEVQGESNSQVSRTGLKHSTLSSYELGGHIEMSSTHWWKNMLSSSELMNYPGHLGPMCLSIRRAIFNLLKGKLRTNLVSLNVPLANKPMKAPIQRFSFSSFGFLALHLYSSLWVDVDSPVKSFLLILEGSWLHVCNQPCSDVLAAEYEESQLMWNPRWPAACLQISLHII